jgi:organic radical activating enzyme
MEDKMKERIRLWTDKLFKTVELIPAGMYHYQSPGDAENQYRLHLRIEPDGNSILILNAATILHLNQTATEYAYYFMQNKSAQEISELMAQRYRIPADQAKLDSESFKVQLDKFINTPDLAPDIFMDFERLDPYSENISAPYRIDCALTYKTSDPSNKKVAPLDRVKRELLTEEWKTILNKIWTATVPQVVFTGGEPTLRPDLPELITYSETLGLVSGLVTDGLRLAEKKYLHQLLNAGLDHLMIILDPDNEQAWEAVRDVAAEDIYETVHLTITKANVNSINKIIEKLSRIKISALSLSAIHPSLKEVVKEARNFSGECGLNLVWDIPVPYSSFNPIALELAEHHETTRGAGKAWLYVEPDGDVLPEQGENTVLGNLLTDEWPIIWKKH